MFTRSALIVASLLAAGSVFAAGPELGSPISTAELAAWDTTVMPDGSKLPAGSGTVGEGARIYVQKCASCHGEDGKGGIASGVGARPPISSINASEKSIGNFWPYATTLFDYIRRAMPWQAPRTLANDEVYALTAYLLSLNKVIGETEVMNATTLPKVRMPNRDGFIVRFPEKI